MDKKEAISNRRRSQYRWTATTSTTTEGGKGGGGGGGPVNTTVMGKVYELGKGSGAMEQQQQQQRRDDVNEFGVDRGRRNATPDLEERGRILSEEPKLAYLEISHTASPSNSVAAAPPLSVVAMPTVTTLQYQQTEESYGPHLPVLTLLVHHPFLPLTLSNPMIITGMTIPMLLTLLLRLPWDITVQP